MKQESLLFITKLHFNKNGNGGQQRTYYLIKELSKYCNVFVLSPYSEKNKPDGIRAHCIESNAIKFEKVLRKNKLFRVVLRLFNWVFKYLEPIKPIHQSNFAYFLYTKQLKALKAKLLQHNVKSVVYDTVSVVTEVNWMEHKILNAHNFDSELYEYKLSAAQNLNERQIDDLKRGLLKLKRYEYNIDQYFTEIWVCSKDDEQKFRSANKTTGVQFYELPNGSDIEERQFQLIHNNYKKLLFVGSLNYFPNVNGLKWFVEHIFKHLPEDYELNIVGKSPNKEDFKFLEHIKNITFIGEVDSVSPYYKNHDVVVVPLLEGSGTRLKILEAFSYGKLVLSTPKGIEGINANTNEDYFEFKNLESFRTNFLSNINDHEKLKRIRENGRRIIEENYSWTGIVKNYLEQKYGK